MKNQDAVLKLAVATLDYSRDGLARVILSKILTAATDVRATTLTGRDKQKKDTLRKSTFLDSDYSKYLTFETLQSH